MLLPYDQPQQKSIVVSGITIPCDEHRRINLNALRHAGGFPESKSPNQWTRLDSAKSLINELINQAGDMQLAPIETVHGGSNPGTYAVEELAIAYANWLSPSFYLVVIRSFIESKKVESPEPMEKLPDPIDSLTRLLELGERFKLIDDHTRILAREAMSHQMRLLNLPPGERIALSQPSPLSRFFKVEDLRSEFPNLKDKHWFNLRGTFGKVIASNIMASDPNCKPLRVSVYVNGAEREVNAWPIEYRDIAVAAIQQYIEKNLNK